MSRDGTAMNPSPCNPEYTTVALLPAEDIVILPSDTVWQVPWELMMLGPFASCGLIDGRQIRHVTVSLMMASAVRHGTTPAATLIPSDYPQLPVFASEMTVFEAAVAVVETGWELAVVMDQDPRVITARSVYCSLVAPKTTSSSVVSPQVCTRPISARLRNHYEHTSFGRP
jgi:hypothetical protein